MRAPLAMPKNAATGRRYSGINVLILWGAVVEHGFAGQSWLTFRQALARRQRAQRRARHHRRLCRSVHPGGGARARPTEGEAPQGIPFLKRFTVFNAEQCDGLPEDIAAAAPPVPRA